MEFGPPTPVALDNAAIAAGLARTADLLEAQHANAFRVAAWRNGADVVGGFPEPLTQVAKSAGPEGVSRLTGLGASLSSVVCELAATGRLAMLARLEGATSIEDLLMRVPGIGPTLALRLHRQLGIDTLEELEVAAHDGRLDRLPHFGPRRIEMVKRELASMLGSSLRRRVRRIGDDGKPVTPVRELPAVGLVLELDVEYRRRAAADDLPKIAPRRFNPERKRWLPILHADKDGWTFTALYSNTARAHERQATHDWVVLYFERDGHEDQCTVVTETHGPISGRRVVRGREAECRAWYAAQPEPV